jgi:hypothetical protein
MFDHPRLGDAIYVITDGDDNASNSTSKEVTQILGAVGVRLFAFAIQGGEIGFSRLQRELELSRSQKLLQTVEDTGGIFVTYHPVYSGVVPFFPDPDLFDKSGMPTRLGTLLASQSRQMLNFYRIDIDLPAIVDKPQELKLELVGFGKSQRDALVVSYPHILLPCQ